MSKDLWGGLFDFNGDGKTSVDEEWIAFNIMEEASKNNSNYQTNTSCRKKKHHPIPAIKPIPDIVDDTNYKALCGEYRRECICAITALVIMLAPAALILWAVYSTYDPKNSASDFLTILFTIAGMVYGGVVLHTTIKSINTSVKNIKTVKSRYKAYKNGKKEMLF